MKSRFRKGSIRILCGSTLKMGIGQNIQTRVVTMHHLDLPMRGDLYEQRIGRGRRAGNTNSHVGNIVYSTEGATRQLEILLSKISMKRKAMSSPRKAVRVYSEETEATVAKMQEELSTDPLSRRKVLVESELKQLDLQRRAHHRTVAIMTKAALEDEKTLAEMRKSREGLKADADEARALIAAFTRGQEERREKREKFDEMDRAFRRQQREMEWARRKAEKESEKVAKKAERAAKKSAKDGEVDHEDAELMPDLGGFAPELVEDNSAAREGEPEPILTAPDESMIPRRDHGFKCTLKGRPCTSFDEAGEIMGRVLSSLRIFGNRRGKLRYIGPFQISVALPTLGDGGDLFQTGWIILEGKTRYDIKAEPGERTKGLALMRALKGFVDADENFNVRYKELQRRYEAEDEAAKAPFEGEERYQALISEKATVNAELMSRNNSVDEEELKRTLEPLLGKYMATTGRPLHPEELKLWNPDPDETQTEDQRQQLADDQRRAELEQVAQEADDQYLQQNPAGRIG